ncbi:MAG: hypothetical protein IJV06_07735 [Bacteroidaceae bacterium]|nr:hypothetical protein [Bacteroidaceae bacterium]
MAVYSHSKHKWTYIWLAIKHRTTPTHVYNLAHNKEEMHKKDMPIMHDLKTRGIIHRTTHHHG